MKTRALRPRAYAWLQRGVSWRVPSPLRAISATLMKQRPRHHWCPLGRPDLGPLRRPGKPTGGERQRRSGRELLAWFHSLEEQVELREAALASMKVASGDLAELQKCEEALTLEAAERTREYERLETTERLVT